MGLPRPVVHQVPPGHALYGRGQVHPDDAAIIGIGAHHRQFQGVQGPAGVPPGHLRQVVQGLLRDLGLHGPQTPFLIAQGPGQDGADVLRRQGLEDKNLGPG